MKPVIGITTANDYKSKTVWMAWAYCRAIEKNGGLPVLLPNFIEAKAEEIIGKLDGLLLTGGGDPDPKYWGEETESGTREIDPWRDSFEFAILREAVKAGIPILGICRGMQLLGIHYGGEILQDISCREKGLKHMQEAPRWYPGHKIKVAPTTVLRKIYQKEEIEVNSFHHQAVAPGENNGYIVSGVASDGIIEAIEVPGSVPRIGVQWHPEGMKGKHDCLFTYFICAAERNRCE